MSTDMTTDLRADIERQRAAVGETVEALVAKTDVKVRAHDKVDDLKEQAGDTFDGLRTQAASALHGVGDRAEGLGGRARKVPARVDGRALVLAAGALVAGVVAFVVVRRLLDQGIGRMLKALRETGQLDNTLILFLSDNGASPENCAAYGPGFDRPSETRDGRPIAYDLKKQIMPGPQTTYASIGQRWANVANTPYQYWKAESYEGGIHTPLIAFWPKGITAKKGSFSAQVGHVMDFMRTFIELAGATYPKTYKGQAIIPTTGVSLVPSFKGKALAGHKTLFNEHFGARYARSDDWKLVSTSRDTSWHLFNLATDKAETQDVTTRYPKKVRQLDSLWHQWANAHQVFPKPGKKN